MQDEGFEDKAGKTILIRTEKRKLLLVGLGKLGELTVLDWQKAFAGVARKAKEVNAKTLTIALPIEELAKKTTMTPQNLIKGAVEGLSLGSYEFLRHKHEDERKKEKKIEEVTFCVDKKFEKEVQKGIEAGELSSKATVFARDLVNEPSSVTTPTFLSLVARSLAKENSEISCTVLGRKEMEKLGMGGILGIAKGSAQEPKFITLAYQPERRHQTVVLVGKGVTFDSGGLSLKKQEGMETMKLDMAGAADILALFSVLPDMKLNVAVIGLIPAVENMPSGTAVKPGDVLTAYNGKTIEVISTDAEGRVILADALSYAKKFNPSVILDLATLTGACIIALGEEVAGFFSNNRALSLSIQKAADKTGEPVWELPLVASYKELLKSAVADLGNVTKNRNAGAITAALFLEAFVPPKIPWAHIDIAGPAWAEKDTVVSPIGATGFGVRLILSYLEALGQEKKKK